MIVNGPGVVPEVCPRQTHSNSLQPTQTGIRYCLKFLDLAFPYPIEALPGNQVQSVVFHDEHA